MTRHRTLRSGSIAGFVLLLVSALAFLPGGGAAVAADSTTGEALSQTKTLTRDYFHAGDPVQSTNSVTVNIDRHTDIQANERIHVTWSGAHPTGGRTANPFGSAGMDQEYPVLILQCRGDADTATPQTCWTASFTERTQSATADTDDLAPDNTVWLDDRYNTAADNKIVSGLTDEQAAALPSDCAYGGTSAAHITPFLALKDDGSTSTFYNCNQDDMPPEAGESGGTPTNEISAFTDGDGNGTADFEVRTDAENQSLGCSNTVQCSVVVVPIMGISCSEATQAKCNLTGQYQPGEGNQNTGTDLTVTPRLWWSPSNWRNRFVFPITVAPAPDVCTSASAGAPVPFYGSELLSQAALQWTPAYCLDKARFNWQDNVMPDDAGFTLMQQGQGTAAALVSDDRNAAGVAYAPTAISGWGVAFNIDSPGGAQLKNLKLNARLLAKLLTQSYPGSATGAARPGLENNPWSINLDPEFQALNPGLDQRHASEAAATLLALNIPSDVVRSLTSYIAADPDAAAFIAGKADPDGMVVNPAYKNVTLPANSWPLLDDWYPKNTGSSCLNANQSPYLAKIASPLSTLRLISNAMLYNWPNVTTSCGFDAASNTYVYNRSGTQGIGNRFMLGLVTLGDAARYGLTVASLQASPKHYVAPNTAGMTAAVKIAAASVTKKTTTPVRIAQSAIRASATAYPGTMVVYTAAKSSGLDTATAAQVSQFIKISTTEGQVPGRGNGKLPSGYLPLLNSGATAGLYGQAQRVAAIIAAQKPPAASPTTVKTGTTGTPTGTPASLPVIAPSLPELPATVPGTPTTAPGASTPVSTEKTVAVNSSISGGLLPLLLFAAIGAGLVSVATRFALWSRGLR